MIGLSEPHIFLNGRSHCPDVALFNMIFHKLQGMTLKLNECKIMGGQFRWKGEEILLFLFQNLFPISSFDTFTPCGEGRGQRRLRESIRNFSYFSNFLPGRSRECSVVCRSQSGMPVLLSTHPISRDGAVPPTLSS